ncbi:MAG: hypothetical protein ABF651_12020, partial [Sporolactobacillus sp.]
SSADNALSSADKLSSSADKLSSSADNASSSVEPQRSSVEPRTCTVEPPVSSAGIHCLWDKSQPSGNESHLIAYLQNPANSSQKSERSRLPGFSSQLLIFFSPSCIY